MQPAEEVVYPSSANVVRLPQEELIRSAQEALVASRQNIQKLQNPLFRKLYTEEVKRTIPNLQFEFYHCDFPLSFSVEFFRGVYFEKPPAAHVLIFSPIFEDEILTMSSLKNKYHLNPN